MELSLSKGRFDLRAARIELKAQRSHFLRDLSPPFAANFFIGDAMDGLVTPTALYSANCPDVCYCAGERALRQDNLIY